MRIERFASLSLPFCLLAFLACSQSGSPVGPQDESPETAHTQAIGDSGSESAIAGSDPEAAGSESRDGENRSEDADTERSGYAVSGDAPAAAVSVVDSALAEVSPVQSEGSGAPPTGAATADPPAPSDQSPTESPEPGPTGSGTESVDGADAGPAPIRTDSGPEAAGAPKAADNAPEDAPRPVFLATDFESEDLACWNGNRAANGVNRAGCGPYTSIGSAPFALAEGGIARSGRKAVSITYAKNEEAGGANVSLNSDSVNVRAYYYFEPGFDFGQGLKIGRVSSFNTAKQVNDVDIILEVRSAKSSNQCGVTDMRDVGLFFNGAPKGSDWGNATATMAFERGRWYAVEYQVVLNSPGKSDGVVRLWVDGKLVAERVGLPIRGSLGAAAKLNVVKIGGWYSNGANGNACANPSQPAKLHMDDVTIAASYIGT